MVESSGVEKILLAERFLAVRTFWTWKSRLIEFIAMWIVSVKQKLENAWFISKGIMLGLKKNEIEKITEKNNLPSETSFLFIIVLFLLFSSTQHIFGEI